MCNKSGLAFTERTLTAPIVVGRDVIEVGAYDVNGSVRPYVESLAPSSYLGVDIAPGPKVDRVLDAQELVAQLGGNAADIVITTEMLEHVRDWHAVVTNLKGVLRPGGYMLVTTRSAGFPYHAWPYDFWRYELDDFRLIFEDLEILALESDTEAPGVFLFAKRPNAYAQRTPGLALYSIVTGRRQRRVTDAQLAWFRATSQIRSAPASVRARVRRASTAIRRLRFRRSVRRRIIGPVWMTIPATIRGHIKRTIRRG
jgi:SAM-dependent methyltransferase